MSRLLTVSSSPHIRTEMTTARIMLWVIAALVPAGLAGLFFFGFRVVLLVAACIVSCTLTEWIWQKYSGQKTTLSDFSAVLTGLLLAYNVPPTLPLWMAVCGSVFAMVIVKHFYGGIGQNIVNPALAGRAMLLTCWPVAMTTWTLHGVSGPTPLAIIKGTAGTIESLPSLADLFIGNVGGCIGETSALALLAGGGLLIYKEIISWRIPVAYIVTVAVISLLFGRAGGVLAEVMSGGLVLGAFFMATDYVTSPTTPRGQVIFAVGCGVITSLIRAFGGYPEGVSYSILIMNVTVPVIDRWTTPRVFGEVKSHGKG
ncbi:MAG: RnfABCDGE type electron transport complex subunit D [Synergistaceae bacterium]|nr:RnfABCDGE type electron transport complex subunit D [Synergistaceae bacterium]